MPEEQGLYKNENWRAGFIPAKVKGLSKGGRPYKIKDWFKRLEMESWWNKKVEDLEQRHGTETAVCYYGVA